MDEDELEALLAMEDSVERVDRRKRVPGLVQQARAEGLEVDDALHLAEWELR